MNPALQPAFQSLLKRTQSRVTRYKQLQLAPPSSENARSLAAEEREIKLVKETVTAVEAAYEAQQQRTDDAVAAYHALKERVVEVVEEAAVHEAASDKMLSAFARRCQEPPLEELPPLARNVRRFLTQLTQRRESTGH